MPPRRLSAPLVLLVALASLVAFSQKASARVLLPTTDVSQAAATLASAYPPIVTNGQDVELTWQDSNHEFFSRDSTDSGETFGPAHDSSIYWSRYFDTALGSTYAKQVGDRIYQAWALYQSGGTFFRYSIDAGQNWTAPVKLSDFSFVDQPTIDALGDRVFIIWDEAGDLDAVSSTDGGVTLSAAKDLGPRGQYVMSALANGGVTIALPQEDGTITVKTFPTGDFTETPVVSHVAVGGTKQPANASLILSPTGSVILAWSWAKDTMVDTKETIRFSYSNDNGSTWATPVILADANSNFEQPLVAAGASGWYFAWGDRVPGGRDLYEHSFYDSGADDEGKVMLEHVGNLGIPFVSSIGDAGYVGWISLPSTPSLKLATLVRGAGPYLYVLPTQSRGGISPDLTAAFADGALDIAFFSVDAASQAVHLFYTRAIITGATSCSPPIGAPDIIAALRSAAGLPDEAPCTGAADVNCDGAVTASDALALTRYVAGLADPPIGTCSPIGE